MAGKERTSAREGGGCGHDAENDDDTSESVHGRLAFIL